MDEQETQKRIGGVVHGDGSLEAYRNREDEQANIIDLPISEADAEDTAVAFIPDVPDVPDFPEAA